MTAEVAIPGKAAAAPPEIDADAFEAVISDPLVDILVGPRVEVFRRKWRRGLSRFGTVASMAPGGSGVRFAWWAFFLWPLWPAYRRCWRLTWINVGGLTHGPLRGVVHVLLATAAFAAAGAIGLFWAAILMFAVKLFGGG